MKNRNRYRNILLISFAVVFVLAAGIGEAWAYFTTYARSVGGYTIQLGFETEIEESFSDWEKRVVISNRPGSQPVYIRAMAFCGGEYELSYSGDNWTRGNDGYWYYDKIVYAGGHTDELKVKIGNIPDNLEDEPEFNVVVIYESTPVSYDAQGNPYADWAKKLDTGRSEGGR